MSDDLHPPSFASSSVQNPPCVLDLSTLSLTLPCWGACQNSKYLTQIQPYPRTRLQLPELGSHVPLFCSIHVQCRWLLLAFTVISHSFHQWVGLSELPVECPPCPSHCTWRGAVFCRRAQHPPQPQTKASRFQDHSFFRASDLLGLCAVDCDQGKNP